MNNNSSPKYLVLIDSPFLFEIANESQSQMMIKNVWDKDFKLSEILQNNFEHIIDFTTLSIDQKYELLSKCQGAIICESSHLCGKKLKLKIPNLVATFGALFFPSQKKVELHLQNQESLLQINSFFQTLGTTVFIQSTNGNGFIFARIMSMIVNEAYFAKEEHLASDEDIDLSMKFGVNYPFGPVELGRGREAMVGKILSNLFNGQGDERYLPSKLLI